MLRVSPSFRIVALALPPGNTGPSAWLTDHSASIFHFHVLPNDLKDRTWVDEILNSLFPESMSFPHRLICSNSQENEKMKLLDNILVAFNNHNLSKFLGESEYSTPEIPSFSLRQLIRLYKRLNIYPDDLGMRLCAKFS
jgi:hypothetical protein